VCKTERKLVLEDGQEYVGFGFGDACDRVCELVFNTSMVGYQEILSDPSYTNQAVVMTYPLIGNYGMAATKPTFPLSARSSCGSTTTARRTFAVRRRWPR